MDRCTALADVTVGNLVCGAESYTPDKNCIIGETAQVPGYFVATGLSGQGLAMAGGLGDVLADMVCDILPQVDVSKMDAKRFLDLHA
ncbi:unnamed protein product, partial [Anisakis simplex]